MTSPFPLKDAALDRWIVDQRTATRSEDHRAKLNPFEPYLYFSETECSSEGEPVPVNTLFLTNRECPWRCLMCDLWKNTLTDTVPEGAIAAQIAYALTRLAPARHIKLYNSGSFFDPRAIPLSEYPAIAKLIGSYERVIVESHPALIGDNCRRFRSMIAGRLEVAMGLETVHPEVLSRLNKRMTLEQFSFAACALRGGEIELRVFILVKPPFMDEDEALLWARRSLDFAFDCGATAATLIPTRGGNGAMEALAGSGDFAPPLLRTLERAVEYGLSLKRGRVFADLWDLERLSSCERCFAERVARLQRMNLTQTLVESIGCPTCGAQHE